MSTALKAVPRSLDSIEQDLAALDALLSEVGGDITEAEAAAAIDNWLAELGDSRDAKLDAYAWRIRLLESHAKAKEEEAKRLAAQRKRDETSIEWLKRRLLFFVQDRGDQIRGKETRQIETSLHRFVETMNGGRRALTLLVRPEDLPSELRQDTVAVAVMADHEAVFQAIADAVKPFGNNVVVDRSSVADDAEIRSALERGEAARAQWNADYATSIRLGLSAEEALAENPRPEDLDIFAFARLEERGRRLEIR